MGAGTERAPFDSHRRHLIFFLVGFFPANAPHTHSADDHPETLVLSRLAQSCFPTLYEERLEETRREREALNSFLPVYLRTCVVGFGSAKRGHWWWWWWW